MAVDPSLHSLPLGGWDFCLDSQGKGCVSYFVGEWPGGTAFLALEGPSGWLSEQVPIPATIGYETSIEIGDDGALHLLLKEEQDLGLWHIERHADGVWGSACLVDGNGNPGRYSALRVAANGDFHASYSTWSGADVRYARGVECPIPICTPDTTTDTYRGIGLALDSADLPHLSYHDGDCRLLYGSWNGICFDSEVIFERGGKYSWLELDSNDRAHVLVTARSSVDGECPGSGPAEVVHLRRDHTGKWSETPVSEGTCGKRSIAIGPGDTLHVVYVDPDLAVGHAVLKSAHAVAIPRLPCYKPAPPESLVASGPPVLGTTFDLCVNDPYDFAGLSHGQTVSLAKITAAPMLGYPCGVPLFGLGTPEGIGSELLISALPAHSLWTSGIAIWSGPGSPVCSGVPLPLNASLAGITLFSQGSFIDLAALRVVLTDGLDLVLGW